MAQLFVCLEPMITSPTLAILLLLPTLALAVPSENVLIGKVVKVTDGDTIVALTMDQKEERIRLWGIDAPENRGGQPYWKASRDQLSSMVAGKTVTVVWDSRDRNSRIIGWVLAPDGQWVTK